MIHRLLYKQIIPDKIDKVWDFFSKPKNLNLITPKDLNFEFLFGGEDPMFEGQLIGYRIQIMPLVKTHWLTEITHIVEGRYFVDEQKIGPYRLWYHEHIFEPTEEGVWMTDSVTYALPFGPFGEIVHTLYVYAKLKYIFDYRKNKIEEIFGKPPNSKSI